MRKTVIIDGYNLVHQVPEFRVLLQNRLAAARSAVVAFCAQWLSVRNDVAEFVLVFDGDPSSEASVRSIPRIRVVFSRTRHGADEAIVAMVRADAACTVVTDDRAILRAAQACGAESLSPRTFHATPRKLRDAAVADRGDKNGLTSAQRSQIAADLARAWGIAPDQQLESRRPQGP